MLSPVRESRRFLQQGQLLTDSCNNLLEFRLHGRMAYLAASPENRKGLHATFLSSITYVPSGSLLALEPVVRRLLPTVDFLA